MDDGSFLRRTCGERAAVKGNRLRKRRARGPRRPTPLRATTPSGFMTEASVPSMSRGSMGARGAAIGDRNAAQGLARRSRKGVDLPLEGTFIEGVKMPDTSSGGYDGTSGTLGQRLKLVSA
tara:strand:+ start:617 stop:979 length:363 start_codon:yes stop_codon:yes gene_type:complete